VSAFSYTSRTKALFRLSTQSVLYAHFRHFWHRTPSSSSWSLEKNLQSGTFGISFILSLSFFHVSSSYPEETSKSLDDKTDGFTSFIPVFTTGLISLLFPQQRGPPLLFAFCCLLRFSQRNILTHPVKLSCTL